jgi:hypothetical protein
MPTVPCSARILKAFPALLIVVWKAAGRTHTTARGAMQRAPENGLRIWWFGQALALLVSLSGCGGSSRTVTLEQIEELRTMESLLPVIADSVVERYKRYEPGLFYATYGELVRGASAIVDSLNRPLPGSLRIDTLAIDHTFESLGEAARRGRTLYLSSSYFYLYENLAVIRSVIWHEFGHVYYARLSARGRMNMEEIWQASRATAMFYVFRDGEYSRNARFGGHPEDSPEELFASAFNLFVNNPDEVTARTGYLTSREADIVQRLREVVDEVSPAR